MEKTDRAVFNVVDRNGRTALHYTAALSKFDDNGIYGWLMTMGIDRNHADNVSPNLSILVRTLGKKEKSNYAINSGGSKNRPKAAKTRELPEIWN